MGKVIGLEILYSTFTALCLLRTIEGRHVMSPPNISTQALHRHALIQRTKTVMFSADSTCLENILHKTSFHFKFHALSSLYMLNKVSYVQVTKPLFLSIIF